MSEIAVYNDSSTEDMLRYLIQEIDIINSNKLPKLQCRFYDDDEKCELDKSFGYCCDSPCRITAQRCT